MAPALSALFGWEYLGQLHKATIQHMDLGNVLVGVKLFHAVAATGEQAHLDGAILRAYDPVFRDTRTLIQVVLS